MTVHSTGTQMNIGCCTLQELFAGLCALQNGLVGCVTVKTQGRSVNKFAKSTLVVSRSFYSMKNMF